MKKYGIKIKNKNGNYNWVLDYYLGSGTSGTFYDDVGPLVFKNNEEASKYAINKNWHECIVEVYPYKDF